MIDYVMSVDLGQAADYSAVAVAHRCWWKPDEQPYPENARLWHEVPVLHQWELGTPYIQIADEIAEMHEFFLRRYVQLGLALVVDQTGVGRPVFEMLRERWLRPFGVTITDGSDVREKDDNQVTVPKRDICSALVVAAQSGEYRIGQDNPFRAEHERQIEAFGYKVNRRTQHVGYESQEHSVHDDLILAEALGLWYSTKRLSRSPPGGHDEAPIGQYDPFTREVR